MARERYDERVDEQTREVLAAIDRVCEEAPRYGAFELTEEYLELLRRLEDRPENQSGADKSWVERARLERIEYYRRVWSSNPDVR